MKKYNSFLGAFFSGDNGDGGYNAAYKKSALAKLYSSQDPAEQQMASEGLARVDPEAAGKWQQDNEAQTRKHAQLLVSLGANNPVAVQAWKTRIKPELVRMYGEQAASLPDVPDESVMQYAQQLAGGSGQPKARSSHILADGTIAYMDEYGKLTRTNEKASNSYGFQTDDQGNVFAQDKRGGTVAPAPMGSIQPPMPQVQQGADPMAGGLDRISQTIQVLKANGVPAEQINAWSEAEFAKLQQGVQGGVVQQPQARVAVKPDAPKVKEAPSGYEFKPDGSLAPIKGGPADPALKPSKAWTPAGLDRYNKVRTDVQVASTLNTMMEDMASLFDDPNFDLGPIQNKKYELANWTGNSTPQSLSYAKLKSNFEKMRNDSLRLNTGVQTDGDAQRAWAEIFANMNDKDLVKARLADIKRYNEFALNEKTLQKEGFEAEFGAPGSKAQQPPAKPAAPQKGDVVKGYRFKGGNPANPQAWEKL